MSRARGCRGSVGAIVAVALMLAGAAPAAAYQNPARTLAGPSGDVVDLGGVAMSRDGRSGGVVYRQLIGGHAHIFVAPYLDGRWRAAQQVDVGQAYDSVFPRIGAGDDGQLVVTWVQEHGVYSDQLWAARLGAGSARFDQPIIVDPNIGEATATFPSLAVAPDGSAYVSYVVAPPATDSQGNLVPPSPSASGSLVLEYHLARILGTTAVNYPALNRRLGALDPVPTAATAPQVAVDATGAGAVAWQEPDDQGIPRVWARRLFSRSVGSLQQISPGTLAGQPLPAAADGFSIALAGEGEGAIAFRQLPIAGSVLSVPRLLVTRLVGPRPGEPASASAQFGTAQPADGLGPFGASYGGTLAPPQVAVSDDGRLAVGYARDSQVRLAGDGALNAGAVGTANVTPAPVALEIGRGGAGVLAWPQDAGGGTVAVQERTFTGRVQTGTASALFPGPVDAVQAAGSTLGDGLVAFQQGRGQSTQIGAVVVEAPPSPFAVTQPAGWLRRSTANVSWQTASAAFGPVTYRVYIDGRLRARTRQTSASITSAVHGAGPHHILVIATDDHGQATRSPLTTVRVDGTPPTVALKGGWPHTRVGRRTLRVIVEDRSSGVDRKRTTVDWGDGVVSAGAIQHHVYAHAGIYRVVISAYDNAGNARRIVQRVEVDQ